MPGSLQQWWMIAPLLVWGSLALADASEPVISGADPFAFDPNTLDPIRFTRADEDTLAASRISSVRPVERQSDFQSVTRQTEFSFKLKPKLPNFSKAGAYGLDLFDSPRLDIRSNPVGVYSPWAVSTLLVDGFEYSAGLRLEHEDALIDSTSYVSSSLLGMSYGRLGRRWYGAIDVNLEQFTSEHFGSDASDVLSLDVTTGRRFSMTGLDANSPLWMLSVQGNVDMREWESNDDLEASSNWFINPSLFWQQPGFMFSAQMQVPVEFETLDEEGKADYRLRAVFEKQFK